MTEEQAPEGRALAIPDEFRLPARATVEERIRQVEDFQTLVQHHLVRDKDYGIIPGTDRPTLLKPGAEKVAKLALLADTYEFIDTVRDWDRPLFAFTIKCRLVSLETGQIISEGLGECNSRESKYRYRRGQRSCPKCGAEAILRSKFGSAPGWYCFDKKGGCGAQFRPDDEAITNQETGRVENLDVADQVNTFIKMAKKRALVDAALSAGRLSDIFTQDMEDRTTSTPNGDQQAPNGDDKGPERQPDEPHSIKSLGDLLNWAKDTYGKKASEVYAGLGVENGKGIKDIAKARMDLEKLWGAVQQDA